MTANSNPDPHLSGRSATGRTGEVWTAGRIRALGAVTDLPTAASIFGLSRSVAYELAHNDEFPVPLIRVGTRYRVPVAAILAALHIAEPAPPTDGDLTAPRRRAWIATRKSAVPAPSTPQRSPEEPTP
jgi:hypothetical protein